MKIIIKHFEKLKYFIKNIIKVSRLLWSCSKFTMISIGILNIILGITVPLILIIWKHFIDQVTEIISSNSQDFSKAVFWLIIHFIVIILSNFIGKLSNYLQRMESDYLNKYTSDLVMDKVSELDLIQFDNPKIYDNIQKINNESVSRLMNILNTFVSFIKNLTVLLGTMTIFLMFNPIIVILCFFSTVPMFFVTVKILLKQFSLYNKRLEKLRLVLYLKTMFVKNENIKEMKIYSIGKYLKNIIITIYQQYINEDKKIRKEFLRDITITDILENTISYGLKIYILIIAIKKYYTIGDLTMYITGIERFQSSISTLLETITSLYEDNLYIDSLFSLLELEPENNNKDYPNKILFDNNFKIIEFRNVWFKYPNAENYVLKNINLEIKSDTVYSLVGMNGSGKTTLIKLLTRLYAPTKGDIYIDGINIKNYDDKSIYKNIGVVFQDFIKFPFDIEKNIGLGNVQNINNLQMIRDAAYKSGAYKFIDQFSQKYKTKLQKEWTGGVDLSLGQWQKLAIARAFMTDGSILVLDEPTASLDAAAEYEIFKTFRKMVKGRTCILIAHRFSTVKLADKIFVIKDGEIIEEGSHESLTKINGEYDKLYEMQAQSYI